MKNTKLTILPGDGIGPEVMDAALNILDLVGDLTDTSYEYTRCLAGGCSIDEYGEPVTDETLEACYASEAVLLGAIGGPKWDTLPHHQKPETGLLKLRKELGLFANLRPARIYNALLDASSLKAEVIRGADVLVVRELTGGIYFGQPRGLDNQRGWNTLVYERDEIVRIARVAFDLAAKRSGRVTSVHKANVLDSSQFWREVVHEVHKDYPNIELSDMYVDNAAMQLVRDPKQFDVIVTQNMFGDILSDIASMITGSLGMLPSASLGTKYAMYEPVHGTAPEIAGQNIANPIAMIGSVAMMLDYTFNQPAAARWIYQSLEQVLEAGYRTADIATSDQKSVSTTRMGELIGQYIRTAAEADLPAVLQE